MEPLKSLVMRFSKRLYVYIILLSLFLIVLAVIYNENSRVVTQNLWEKVPSITDQLQTYLTSKVSDKKKELEYSIENKNKNEVNRITQLQLKYLQNIQNKIPKSNGLRSVVQNDNIRNGIQKDNTRNGMQNDNIRREYDFRVPDENSLLQLSPSLQEVERVTDPFVTSSTKCKGLIFLTVLVMSAPTNFDRREYIRDTWSHSYTEDIASLKTLKSLTGEESFIPEKDMFRVVFVLGQSKSPATREKVQEEAKLHQDMVFGSFLEDYTNLTMKTRLGFKWVSYDCNSVYVLKTDDDVFINAVGIVEWLKDMPRTNFYTGWCNFNSPVVRNPRSKWFVSEEIYPANRYPGYCLGGGYLMSNDVVGKVLTKSYGRQLFPMEDLYIGLMIHEMKEVKVTDDKKHFDLIYEGRSDDCDLNDLFLAHRVVGTDLVDHAKRTRNALTSCSGSK